MLEISVPELRLCHQSDLFLIYPSPFYFIFVQSCLESFYRSA